MFHVKQFVGLSIVSRGTFYFWSFYTTFPLESMGQFYFIKEKFLILVFTKSLKGGIINMYLGYAQFDVHI